MNFDTLKSTALSSQITINGATITPSSAIAGPIAEFKQTHWVKDASGKSASVYVKVLNAPSGLTYTSKVLPKEGSIPTTTQVSAEQWLTVPKADSIKCTATASYGTTRSASAGLEEYKNSLIAGDYVTLSGYYSKAVTTGTSVLASQTATSGAANSIKIYGSAKDSSGTSRVDTAIKGLSGGKATFSGLGETATTGTTTTNQVSQKEHLHGTFTSTASYTPSVGTALYNTRTSNYGTEYDINMKAVKGSLPTGILGYYVRPGTTASKIQVAVTAAQSKDTINVATGTYIENVKIDKSLTVKGAGATQTIVDGNNAGSVFNIGKLNRNIDVVLSSVTIQRGSGTLLAHATGGGNALFGGGILNFGRLTVTSSKISGNTVSTSTTDGYGGGIFNDVGGTVAVTGSTISGNIASSGGGLANWGTATVTSSTISQNDAKYYGGGIDNYGGTTTITGSTISKNSAFYGGGIYSAGDYYSGTTTPATLKVTGTTISSNNCLRIRNVYGSGGAGWSYPGCGGGIFNDFGSTATITGSTVSSNSAIGDGSGVDNNGKMTVTSSTISGNSGTGSFSGPNIIYSYGGGIYNGGYFLGSIFIPATLVVQGASTISGNYAHYGGGIQNSGTATITGSAISGNLVEYKGGGIANNGRYKSGTFTPANLRVTDTTISSNKANWKGGGIDNTGNLFVGGSSRILSNQATTGSGGGINSEPYYSTCTVTLDGTRVTINLNKARLPDLPLPTNWYQQYGVYMKSGVPITTGGFNPATQVTGNTKI